ncbi:MAG: tetratricopeptide repeat protein [Candidatus Thorarchaeota archaeon]|jgi:lipoprotein NlpI
MDPIDASMRTVDKHLEANPDDASAWNAKGVFHAQKREFGEALRSLDRALQLDPNLAPAHTNRGRVLLALGPEKASMKNLHVFDKSANLFRTSGVCGSVPVTLSWNLVTSNLQSRVMILLLN